MASKAGDTVAIKPGELTLTQRIGRGSYGSVYKATHTPTGDSVAVKVIDLELCEDDIEDIQQEIAVHAQCSCPQLTRYITSFTQESQLWIVMEYLAGGSASKLLGERGGLPENIVAYIMFELLHGLAYLHKEGKIHRDIKASNVLLAANGAVKLADFGVTGQLTDSITKRNTFVGTPFWMAPEVIKQSRYDARADMWSLGITAMELATGAPPYSNIHPMRVLFLIPKNPPPQLDPSAGFSKHFVDFVGKLLQKEPSSRPLASALLKHKFVKSVKPKKAAPALAKIVQKALAHRASLAAAAASHGVGAKASPLPEVQAPDGTAAAAAGGGGGGDAAHVRSNSGFDSEGGLSGDMVSPSQDTADAAPADAFPSAPVPAPAPAPAPGSAPAPYYDVASGAVGDDDDGWNFVATVVSKPAVAIPAANNNNSGAGGGATGAGGGAGAGLSALLPPSKYAADGNGGSGDSSSAAVGEAVDVVAKVFSPALEEVVEVCGSRGTPSIALASALAQVGRALGNLRSVELAEGRTASGPDDKQLCPSLHLLRTLLATVERDSSVKAAVEAGKK